MAIYRFKISFEDYDEVIREIDMPSTSTFEDLHLAIQKANAYPSDVPASFYKSNDQWRKGEEITYMPGQEKQDREIREMKDAKLNRYIDDPHQKFYYTYNFAHPVYFHVQLIKISKEDPGLTYPHLFRSVGTSPKLFDKGAQQSSGAHDTNETFELFNDMDFESNDAEDMHMEDEDGNELREDDFDSEMGSEEDDL